MSGHEEGWRFKSERRKKTEGGSAKMCHNLSCHQSGLGRGGREKEEEGPLLDLCSSGASLFFSAVPSKVKVR